MSLRFAEDRLRWPLETSGPRASTPDHASACRGLVDARRATSMICLNCLRMLGDSTWILDRETRFAQRRVR